MIRLTEEQREACPWSNGGTACDNYDCREFEPDCAAAYQDGLLDDAADRKIDQQQEG